MQDNAEQAPPAWGVDKRLTPTLAARGFTPVPSILLDHYHKMNLNSAEVMVLVHLLSYKWNLGRPFPRLSAIAKKMDLSPKTVRTHLASLEKKDLLRRVPRAGQSNEFDLTPLFRRLEEIARTEPRRPSRKKRTN